jgi:hypothetical protein
MHGPYNIKNNSRKLISVLVVVSDTIFCMLHITVGLIGAFFMLPDTCFMVG